LQLQLQHQQDLHGTNVQRQVQGQVALKLQFPSELQYKSNNNVALGDGSLYGMSLPRTGISDATATTATAAS